MKIITVIFSSGGGCVRSCWPGKPQPIPLPPPSSLRRHGQESSWWQLPRHPDTLQATCMMYVGLTMTTAAQFQMLRGKQRFQKQEQDLKQEKKQFKDELIPNTRFHHDLCWSPFCSFPQEEAWVVPLGGDGRHCGDCLGSYFLAFWYIVPTVFLCLTLY